MSDTEIQLTDEIPVSLVECPHLYQNFRLDTPYKDEETVYFLRLTLSGLNVRAATCSKMGDLMCLYPSYSMKLDDRDTTNCWH